MTGGIEKFKFGKLKPTSKVKDNEIVGISGRLGIGMVIGGIEKFRDGNVTPISKLNEMDIVGNSGIPGIGMVIGGIANKEKSQIDI